MTEEKFTNMRRTERSESSLNVPWLDLVVERFVLRANNRPAETEFKAMLDAASKAEGVLYVDINGALQLDMIPLWGLGGEHQKYPERATEHKDKFASWHTFGADGWMINPFQYAEEVHWLPYDGMQKFNVRTTAKKIGKKYQGLVMLDAFVWDDARELGMDRKDRTGCLLDIVHRNKENLISVIGTRVPIDLDINKKEDIKRAYISDYGVEPVLVGFNYEGYTSERKLVFRPIDVEDRCEACNYRDR